MKVIRFVGEAFWRRSSLLGIPSGSGLCDPNLTWQKTQNRIFSVLLEISTSSLASSPHQYVIPSWFAHLISAGCSAAVEVQNRHSPKVQSDCLEWNGIVYVVNYQADEVLSRAIHSWGTASIRLTDGMEPRCTRHTACWAGFTIITRNCSFSKATSFG